MAKNEEKLMLPREKLLRIAANIDEVRRLKDENVRLADSVGEELLGGLFDQSTYVVGGLVFSIKRHNVKGDSRKFIVSVYSAEML